MKEQESRNTDAQIISKSLRKKLHYKGYRCLTVTSCGLLLNYGKAKAVILFFIIFFTCEQRQTFNPNIYHSVSSSTMVVAPDRVVKNKTNLKFLHETLKLCNCPLMYNQKSVTN